jgi:hypothetical protein
VQYTWYSNGQMYPSRANEITHWLTQSGWTKDSDTFTKDYNNPCSYFTAQSIVSFYNPIFVRSQERIPLFPSISRMRLWVWAMEAMRPPGTHI